ncbi:phage scaffolding protein [Sporosarcina trichiuri]|uniref:phage scaffolding protein n=1 Tax=Sporosarcina trichiuri TaxID=3056445 RepID=UPI0025B3BC61|nr:phage scaffolding protein [Sporosarcina sp. 0.2-SM1T-5]WJY27467.1 phage scaffolding protein [Sporosarcina sp. 0.2-SM1T-5]
MNKEQLKALGLTDEQADQVIAGYGQMIPKSRLDDKIEEVKSLNATIADRDKQLKELKKVDAEGLQAKITELEESNKKAKAEYEEKLKATQLNSAVKLALAGKVHDADLVAGLIDGKTIELDQDGKVTKGLDEQLKTLQEAKSFLFLPKEAPADPPAPRGTKPAEGNPAGKPAASVGASFAQQMNEQHKPENNPWS